MLALISLNKSDINGKEKGDYNYTFKILKHILIL